MCQGKHCKVTFSHTELKRKGSICSFFSRKGTAREIQNEQLSKVDREDEVDVEREGQQKHDRDRI